MANLDEKTKTWMMSPEGIKALWDRFDRVNQELSMMWNWLAEMSVGLENNSPRRITAPGTTTAGTQAVPWDAPEAEPTTPTPSPSQSATAEQQSGRAEPSSECAHAWMGLTMTPFSDTVREYTQPPFPDMAAWCRQCGALRLLGLIRVPVAPTTSSTSASEPSRKSVENSVEEPARLPLSELSSCVCGHSRASHMKRGGVMGVCQLFCDCMGFRAL